MYPSCAVIALCTAALNPFHAARQHDNTINYTARQAAAQCIVIGSVCGCVCGSVITITRIACIDLHQTWFVGKGSDLLQVIKFWPYRAPWKGVCGGAKIFGSALLQPARCMCVSSERFLHHTSITVQGLKWRWWPADDSCLKEADSQHKSGGLV